MVETFSAGNVILTQGFQQPVDNVTGIMELTHDEFGTLVAYPNPAVDYLWYGIQFPTTGKVSIQLTNALGQTVRSIDEKEYKTGKVVEPISVSEFAAGLYFLTATFVGSNDHQTHVSTKKFEIIR
ncbi:MAG: hypothetical protein JWO06_3970 [Bacteroidota bacterium]|nr:hypothetical protein [Bacteroidota bacterium]